MLQKPSLSFSYLDITVMYMFWMAIKCFWIEKKIENVWKVFSSYLLHTFSSLNGSFPFARTRMLDGSLLMKLQPSTSVPLPLYWSTTNCCILPMQTLRRYGCFNWHEFVWLMSVQCFDMLSFCDNKPLILGQFHDADLLLCHYLRNFPNVYIYTHVKKFPNH